MIFSWSTRRQLIVLGIVLSVLAIPASYALFSYIYKPPTCFDQEQNQGELGVDCGGSCLKLCPVQVTDLIVRWSRALKVLPGVYDAVAFIENPNFKAGVSKISYTFKLYDKDNLVIIERSGATHVNPNEQFVIYEPALRTSDRVPARAFFEFTEVPAWISVAAEKPGLYTKNERLENAATRPRLRALLVNPSLSNVRNVVVTALLFDKKDNVIAVGKTEVDFLPKSSEQNITFSWPDALEQVPEVCTTPLDIMLVFDRSGSMNDDGLDPPQPITDAKNAAVGFIEALSTEDQVGISSFATRATQPLDRTLTKNHSEAKSAMLQVNIAPEEESGFTNLGDGIDKATGELLSSRHNGAAKKAIVVLTDGLANAPQVPGGEAYAADKAGAARENDIRLYVIGLGTKVNAEFLTKEIAFDPSRYFGAEKSTDLFKIYKDIANVVCPERTYPLVVFSRANLVE